MKINLFLIILTSLLLVNCPDKPVDPVAKNAPLLILATQSKPATVATTPLDARPSSCNTTGVAAGCGSNRGGNFSCTAARLCYTSYDLCAVDTSCQSFSYSRTFTALRIGDSVNATISVPLSGSNIVYSVTSGTLPAGLTVIATSGVISGTTTTALATSTVVVSATNSTGSSTSSNTMRVYSATEAAPLTCNTTGTSPRCTAGSPFSCTSAASCFSSLTACQTSTSCVF